MRGYKTPLFVATALSVIAMSTPALAQNAAAEEAESSTGVGDIVVTAQRREENLQKVPVAVTAVGPVQLEAMRIDSATKVEKLVPSLSLTPEVGSVTLFLRGVGSTITAVGNEASVAMYVDGVYYSRLAPALLRLNNVERIEVLKGPQGTLFGRNASGGLVQVITKTPKPGQEFEGNASVGYGNYNTIDASGYVAGSLSDSIALDLSGVYHRQKDGWGDNLTTGGDNYTDKAYAFRSKLAIDMGPDTRAVLTGEYAYSDSDIAGPVKFRDHPQASYDPTPGKELLPKIGFYDSLMGNPNLAISKYTGVSLRLEHDLEFATIINTAAYHNIKQSYQIDGDSGPNNFITITLPSRSKEFMNELQIVSAPSSPFDWSAGVFYMDQKQKYNPAHVFGSFIDGALGGVPGSETQYNSYSAVKALSGFGQARFTIVENLKLTLGARYSRDKLHGMGNTTLAIPGAPDFIVPGTDQDDRRTVKKLTYKGSLDYQFSPDVLGYASISRGYKGSTYSMIPFTAPPAKPEVLDAYELGLKTELFDRTLRLNGAVFYYDISNPQVITTPLPGQALTSNAKSARIKGAEIEIEWRPVQAFRFSGALTYLDAKYKSYTNAGATDPNPNFPFGNLPTVPRDASGNNMVRAPKWAGSVAGQYTIEMESGAAIDLSANMRYTDRIYFEPDNRLSQGPLALVGAQISYTLPNKTTEFRIWGENLTDRKYYATVNAVGGGQGDIGSPGAPMTFGFTASQSF